MGNKAARYVISSSLGKSALTSCEIGISIGNPAHEGDKLKSILKWVDKRFENCIITLSDTLYRYTYMAQGMDEAQAYFTALREGELWLERNREAFKIFDHALLQFDRWNKWLKHPDYPAVFQQLSTLYKQDGKLQNAFAKDVSAYISRCQKRGEDIDVAKASENSLAYLIEETACYILIGRAYEAWRAYPSRDMACFRYMRRPDIPENLKGIEKAPHLELNFKRKIKAPASVVANDWQG